MEGLFYADYRFSGVYTKPDPKKQHTAKSAQLITSETTAAKNLQEARTLSEALNLSKELVNLPSNIVTPSYLEKEARKVAGENKKVTLTVLTEEEMEKEKMGAFLAVARGSREPARMIILEYRGNPRSRTTFIRYTLHGNPSQSHDLSLPHRQKPTLEVKICVQIAFLWHEYFR